jgi:signal transduction histidine kinase
MQSRAQRTPVAATGGRFAITISDDGTGFDVTQPHAGHLGLATIRERAEALGAELSVSAASETGTTVRVIVDAQPSAATDRDG